MSMKQNDLLNNQTEDILVPEMEKQMIGPRWAPGLRTANANLILWLWCDLK